MARVRSLLVNERRDDTENEPMLLNSFFINDLDKVADKVEKNKPGAALANYLTAPENLDTSKRENVRSSSDYIFDTLSPTLFPLGRWPEAKGHPLVTSQQFAIWHSLLICAEKQIENTVKLDSVSRALLLRRWQINKLQ